MTNDYQIIPQNLCKKEKNMKVKNLLMIGLALSCLLISSVACEKEGTAEKAGKEVDKAFDSAKQKLNETTK
jgi:hypothetical protein